MKLSPWASAALLFVLGADSTSALDQPSPARERGLPVMNVYGAATHGGGPQTFDVAQDTRGVMYFGNLAGLLTWDGSSWRLIKLPDEQAPLSVASDMTGRVALGLVNDFGYLAADSVGSPRYESLLPTLPPSLREVGDVRDVCSTPRGFLFVTSARLLLRDERATHVVAEQDDEKPLSRCGLVDGKLFVMGRGGLRAIDLKTQELGPPLVDRPVSAIFRAGEGSLIVHVREDSLYKVGRSMEKWAPAASDWLRTRIVVGLATLADGRIAIATRGHEVIVLSPAGEVVEVISERSGLPESVLNGVFVDREGALWLPMEGPIVRVDIASPVSLFDSRSGIKGIVADVARFGSHVYAASDHGLYRSTREGWQRLPGFPRGVFRLLSVAGDFLIGTVDGLYRLQPDGSATRILELTLAGDLLRAESDPDRVWIASEEHVIAVRKTDGHWVKEQQIEVRGGPTSLVERFGILWCGTTFGGVVRVEQPLSDAPRLTVYGKAELNVYEIGGRLVVVRAEDGAVFEPVDATQPDGTITHTLQPEPILGRIDVSDDFFVIVEDASGDVWVNSNPPRVIRRKSDGHFDPDARPLSSVTSTDIQMIRAERNGLVWFCSDAGLFLYDRRIAPAAVPSQPPLIRRVSTGSGAILYGGAAGLPMTGTTLKSGFGRIRFEFAPGSLTPGVVFQHRLEPAEDEWNAWTDSASIDYTTLEPGAYTFRLRARSGVGAPSSEAHWSFIVLPPWYRTWIAWVAWILLAFGLIAGFIRLRTHALHRQADVLRAKVDEQTAKLRDTVGLLEQTNHELQEAQEKIARFNESSGEALRDVRAWSRETAADLAASVHASQILVFIEERGELVPLSASDVRPPRLEELEHMGHKQVPLATPEGHGLVPVVGLSGRLFGALAVVGKTTPWSEPERQLVSTFAHQFGGALELQQVRTDLAEARERNLSVRRQMTERGIQLVEVCPSCSRCFEEHQDRCPDDGAILDTGRVLPYRIAGRYRLVRVLGSGGMGEVFLARDERLERDVAVKVIRSGPMGADARSRFDREARAVARVQHPNVVAIFDSGELEEGSAFIVTVVCTLGTLAAGQSATVTLTVRATAGATITNTATVSAAEYDPTPANGSSTVATAVIGGNVPALSEWMLLMLGLLMACTAVLKMR